MGRDELTAALGRAAGEAARELAQATSAQLEEVSGREGGGWALEARMRTGSIQCMQAYRRLPAAPGSVSTVSILICARVHAWCRCHCHAPAAPCAGRCTLGPGGARVVCGRAAGRAGRAAHGAGAPRLGPCAGEAGSQGSREQSLHAAWARHMPAHRLGGCTAAPLAQSLWAGMRESSTRYKDWALSTCMTVLIDPACHACCRAMLQCIPCCTLHAA